MCGSSLGYSLIIITPMQAATQAGEMGLAKANLLVGVTGSVAAIKLTQLLDLLMPHFNVKVIVTQHGRKFLQDEGAFMGRFGSIVHHDEMEWEMWRKRGDPVLHIQLRKWADFLLIAPLSANTLAKLSNGLCDNLLTLVCRAWSMQKSQSGHLKTPIIICPSMNTMMWDHPITQTQLKVLKGWGYEMLGPIVKKMMCGDFGNGAMSEVEDIVKYMLGKLKEKEEGEEKKQ